MTRPHLWVIAGPNGSGKSGFALRYGRERLPIINPDEIAKSIDAERRNELQVLLQAGKQALIQRASYIAQRRSFAFETTLTGHTELRSMQEAAEAGFKTNLVFVGIRDVALSFARVRQRVTANGHDVPAADIERRFPRSFANLPRAAGIAERVFLIDNTSDRPRLVLSREAGRDKYVARNVPPWAQIALSRPPFKLSIG